MSIRINVGATFDARDIRQARKELDALERQAQGLQGGLMRAGRGLQNFGSGLASIGSAMTQSLTVPILGAATAATKLAADFSESMSRITGLVGIAADEVKAMEAAVIGLSGETAKSPQELAEGLFVVTSAGLRGAEAMEALEFAAKAGAAGLGATNDIARAVAGAINAYGAETLDAARATDVIVATARAGNFATDQFAGALGRVLPFAQQAQASLEDVGGAVALLTRTNGNAAESITQIQALFRAFVVPTEEAKKVLDEVGLSAADLREEMGKNGLVAALRLLDTRLGGNREVMGRLLSSTEAASAAFQILNSDAATIEATFGDVNDAVGMTEEAFGVVSGQPAFKFRQALNDLQIAGINLGNELIPVVVDLIERFQGLVDKFNDLSPAQQDTIIKWGAIIALTGPLVAFAGAVVFAIGTITAALGAMSAAMIIATGGLVLLAGLAGFAAFKAATTTYEQRRLEEATRDLAIEQDKLAGKYGAAAQAAAEARRETRLAADAARYAGQAAYFAGGGFNYLAVTQGDNTKETEAAVPPVNDLQDALDALGEVAGGTSSASAGPRIVALTQSMRELFQGLNETYVGAGNTGDAIAQFSREVLAMGNITDATVRGAERLAQVIRQDIDRSLADANRRLDEAVGKFNAYRDSIMGGIRSGNTLADATRNQAAAQDALARAQAAYADAVASEDEDRIADAAKDLANAEDNQKTFLEFLGVGVTTAEGFAAQIDALRQAGASLEVVQQIAELGARTGGRVAAELLAGGAAAIEQANQMVTAVENASRRAGVAAAEQFFGAGVNAAKAMVRGIEATIPELQGVLDRIADAIERAMGARPNVDITGRTGPFIPQDSPGTGGGGGGPAPTPTPIRTPFDAGRVVPLGEVRFFAEGGLVMGPTLGVVGEAGPEVVVPLDRLDMMGGGKTVINVTVTSADPEAVVEAIRRYTRGNGPLGQVVSL
ncbi:MAG TPA: phage tail tape measure protein [Acidimicrobiia bacterium]